MPYNESLADRIREALVDHPKVEEKKMFRGVTFMVGGKMCICVSGDELLCRVGPVAYEEALSKDHTREMGKGAKVLKGYLYVGEEGFT